MLECSKCVSTFREKSKKHFFLFHSDRAGPKRSGLAFGGGRRTMQAIRKRFRSTKKLSHNSDNDDDGYGGGR